MIVCLSIGKTNLVNEWMLFSGKPSIDPRQILDNWRGVLKNSKKLTKL